jgi:hypothetical protein
MTDKTTITSIKRLITNRGLQCKVMRIGTGKNFEIGLHGRDAERLAIALCGIGFERTPMSGNGTRINPITLDR